MTMTPADLVSIAAGSAILLALSASVAITRGPRRISTVSRDWKKMVIKA